MTSFLDNPFECYKWDHSILHYKQYRHLIHSIFLHHLCSALHDLPRTISSWSHKTIQLVFFQWQFHEIVCFPIPQILLKTHHFETKFFLSFSLSDFLPDFLTHPKFFLRTFWLVVWKQCHWSFLIFSTGIITSWGGDTTIRSKIWTCDLPVLLVLDFLSLLDAWPKCPRMIRKTNMNVVFILLSFR